MNEKQFARLIQVIQDGFVWSWILFAIAIAATWIILI